LSFFTFTDPRAAGTTDEVKKAVFVEQELTANSIVTAEKLTRTFLTTLFSIVVFIVVFFSSRN
jgi:hypothetical protein